jgi:hypothetical protein
MATASCHIALANRNHDALCVMLPHASDHPEGTDIPVSELSEYGTARRVPNRAFSDEYVARCDRLWMDCRKLNGLAGKS